MYECFRISTVELFRLHDSNWFPNILSATFIYLNEFCMSFDLQGTSTDYFNNTEISTHTEKELFCGSQNYKVRDWLIDRSEDW